MVATKGPTMNFSSDAQAAVREYSVEALRAAADLAERREKATPEFALLGFELANQLGIEQAPKGDPQGRRWAAAVRSRIEELLAGPGPQTVKERTATAGDHEVEHWPAGPQPTDDGERA